jgi:hypothetical protein
MTSKYTTDNSIKMDAPQGELDSRYDRGDVSGKTSREDLDELGKKMKASLAGLDAAIFH